PARVGAGAGWTPGRWGLGGRAAPAPARFFSRPPALALALALTALYSLALNEGRRHEGRDLRRRRLPLVLHRRAALRPGARGVPAGGPRRGRPPLVPARSGGAGGGRAAEAVSRTPVRRAGGGHARARDGGGGCGRDRDG